MVYSRLCGLTLDNEPCNAKEVEGAKAGSDIQLTTSRGVVGIECKNKGAFEGGVKKMTYNGSRLEIAEESIHRRILGDKIVYQGMNLPWYCDKRTAEDWNEVKSIFGKDEYIEADCDAVSNYYADVGTHYIQIEGHGLYHTGSDILGFGVPYFTCPIKLRIRTTKHKNKAGIPTDVTAALQFDKKSLAKSIYSLDDPRKLPPSMTPLVE